MPTYPHTRTAHAATPPRGGGVPPPRRSPSRPHLESLDSDASDSGLVVVDAVVVEKIVGIVVEVVDPRVVGVGFERERGESRSRAFLP
jgi:hypothetical protein